MISWDGKHKPCHPREEDTMPLYELVLESSYYNQECINVFNYVSSGESAATLKSLLLIKAMGLIPDNGVYPTGKVFEALRAIQSNAVSYIQVTCRDVYSNVDFYENPYVVNPTGIISNADGLSPASAYGLRTNRTRNDIRRGQKRFVGVVENGSGPGGVIPAGTLTSLATLAQRMSAALTITDEGNTVTFNPVVVAKQKYEVEGSVPERFAYRYYPTFAEQSTHIMSGILYDPYTTIRTQSSRQYGRGR